MDSSGGKHKRLDMSEYSPNLYFIPDIPGDPRALATKLRAAGVKVTRIADGLIPRYDVLIPDDVRIVVMGDYLGYARGNLPDDIVHHDNAEVAGMISALSKLRNATVLVGTNELDAMGIIERNDKVTVEPRTEITQRLQDLCANGFINHAASVVIDRGLQVNPDVMQRRTDFHIDLEFVVTHAGITYGTWQSIGAPVDATTVVLRLNDDLLRASRALVASRKFDDVRIRFPQTLTASKYVQKEGVDKVSSPTSAHAHELHRSWSFVWCNNPRFGQLRAHMSLFTQHHFQGNEFSYEGFHVGFGKALYPGIIARLSPIISLYPSDRHCPGPDRGNIMVKGDVMCPRPVHSRIVNGQSTKLRSATDISPYQPARAGEMSFSGRDLFIKEYSNLRSRR